MRYVIRLDFIVLAVIAAVAWAYAKPVACPLPAGVWHCPNVDCTGGSFNIPAENVR